MTPVSTAAKRGNDAVLVGLLGTGHVWPPSELTEALLRAAENGHIACVAELLAVGRAEVDGAGEGGVTALMKCGRHDHPVCAANLLREGADLSLTDDEGRNAIMHACAAGTYHTYYTHYTYYTHCNYYTHCKHYTHCTHYTHHTYRR